MPAFGPIKRRDCISGLRKIGFSGPYSGGKHQYMLQGTKWVRIPNPHQGDVSVSLLRQILAEADITRDEWESVQAVDMASCRCLLWLVHIWVEDCPMKMQNKVQRFANRKGFRASSGFAQQYIRVSRILDPQELYNALY